MVLDSRLRARTLRGFFDILASPPTAGAFLQSYVYKAGML
ncbi:hypothetical protein HMPREF0239_02522 [Clostridium sp. ATCC BAA-442]|nr:hypothetical protein HMPREF0239_02522 [Clostridium sp. ATCC BAA-442]